MPESSEPYLPSTLPFLPEETLVVPIPTASGRVRKRGFDQAKLIAKVFARSRGLKYTARRWCEQRKLIKLVSVEATV
jgi:predicted amidophosphoribosyltransferase